MEFARDLASADLWAESLERSLARRGRPRRASLELGRLTAERDLADPEHRQRVRRLLADAPRRERQHQPSPSRPSAARRSSRCSPRRRFPSLAGGAPRSRVAPAQARRSTAPAADRVTRRTRRPSPRRQRRTPCASTCRPRRHAPTTAPPTTCSTQHPPAPRVAAADTASAGRDAGTRARSSTARSPSATSATPSACSACRRRRPRPQDRRRDPRLPGRARPGRRRRSSARPPGTR